jgi:Ferredoxin-dependent bilin reductase
MTRLQDAREPLERFRALFAAALPAADRMEFYANRVTPEGETYLRAETYSTPLLARLVLEEYVVGGRMHGVVIMALPRPEIELPIFFFQLGGIGPRSIAVLDISPTTPDLDLSALAPAHKKYRELLGLEPTTVGWLKSVCSPYLLHCAYKDLDEDLYVDAMTEYFTVWFEQFYRSNASQQPTTRPQQVSNALYKFKYQLHHFDPAYEFFVKAWGTATADAFVDLECGDPPSFRAPTFLDQGVKPWHDVERNLVWSDVAQRQVMEREPSEQEALRARVEERAASDGMGIITGELLAAYN